MRYGWTDDVILNLPYARFVQISRTVGKEMNEERERELEGNAFLGWQMAMAQGYKKEFACYLRSIGLKDLASKKYKITKTMKENEIRKARKNSKIAILALRRNE